MVVHEKCIWEWIDRGNFRCEICGQKYTVLNLELVPFILFFAAILLSSLVCFGFIFIPSYHIFFSPLSFLYATTLSIFLHKQYKFRIDVSMAIIVPPAAFAYITIIVCMGKPLFGVYLQLAYVVAILPIHCFT